MRRELHPQEDPPRCPGLDESCVAAVHGGSSSSSGLLASETGHVHLVCSQARGMNRQEAGDDAVLETIQTFHTLLLRGNKLVPNAHQRCKRLILAPAGLCQRLDASQFHAWIDSSAWTAVEPLVLSDARAALLAGALQDWGIVIMAGSTSVAYGRTTAGTECWAGGGASPIGNEGSGFSIATQALNAVLQRHDGRLDQGAALETCILSHLHRLGLPSLLSWVTTLRDRGALLQLATIAQDVTLAAEIHHDPVAKAILENAAVALLTCFDAVRRRLAFAEDRIPVIIAGGVIENSGIISSILQHEIPVREPRAVVSFPLYRPLAGALLFGLSGGQKELIERTCRELENSLRTLPGEQIALLVGPARRKST